MLIVSKISGVIAKSAHPVGCHEAICRRIRAVQQLAPIRNGPKKVLILGASSGFGLATRIAVAFGGAKADTIGVSFERGPSEKGVGSAGWYNNIFFREEAEKAGLIARNFIGDAFSPQMCQEIIRYIRDEFGGKIDMLVYSLATGVRLNPKTGEMWRAALKPTGSPYTGNTLNIEKGILEEVTVEPATDAEVDATIKIMGGEVWENWVDELSQAGVLADGFHTFAYSYIGPKSTYRIYYEGTLGKAKQHLHQSADKIEQKLAAINGHAYAVICKALVTKASSFIPALSEYTLALFKVMKEKGIHEGCIEQMQRLYARKVYNRPAAQTDPARLIRMDDWEMREDVQTEVTRILSRMTRENFRTLGDYQGYISDFMQLNGFGFDNVNYQQEISFDALLKLKP